MSPQGPGRQARSTGHGLSSLHWGQPHTGLILREGMVFTVEPMLNQGSAEVHTGEDGWSVLTRDGRLSEQFEHTVAVTRNGVRVLTLQ